MTHALKCWPQFFAEVLAGNKLHEVRKDDRGFNTADEIILQEWNPETKRYTGREWKGYISSVTREFKGLGKGFVVLSIKSNAAMPALMLGRGAMEKAPLTPFGEKALSEERQLFTMDQSDAVPTPNADNVPWPEEAGLVQPLPQD